MPKPKGWYRCKTCGFETEKKDERWQHKMTHIKPEKQLRCDSCQFVTEYKHHLQYHKNNHDGYKPYKCDNCDYQCVNKSMLNSHMKSHSNVCEYKCADCKYAAKYVHSLKLHVEKYCHQPQRTSTGLNCFDSATAATTNTATDAVAMKSNQFHHEQKHNKYHQPQTLDNGILDLRISSKLIK